MKIFLPLGDCLLAVNNVLHARREAGLKATFREALPLIARVAGGEAVLFDRQGIRFFTVDPDGKESDRGMGELTYLGRQAMELGRPVIGPSLCKPIGHPAGDRGENLLPQCGPANGVVSWIGWKILPR
ncbi:hypothetical protein J2Z49_000853 [Desulfofundulus luciae]|uniref:Uncharacterized protein n=1 Tax=Desulfofundulus luciae TaxID=74702 RepID=A0ABU0AZ46_9FIRM|nr:hypothetical protein [Desulfofundulus luciae]MDQ0285748.1 hypothetical protein [Desulfofundulus luciae]